MNDKKKPPELILFTSNHRFCTLPQYGDRDRHEVEFNFDVLRMDNENKTPLNLSVHWDEIDWGIAGFSDLTFNIRTHRSPYDGEWMSSERIGYYNLLYATSEIELSSRLSVFRRINKSIAKMNESRGRSADAAEEFARFCEACRIKKIWMNTDPSNNGWLNKMNYKVHTVADMVNKIRYAIKDHKANIDKQYPHVVKTESEKSNEQIAA